jgi:hypothetical protein
MVLPKVGDFVKNVGRLIKVEEVPPVVPVKDYIFESTSARVETRVNGHVVKSFSTFCDWGGRTCIDHAIEEAKHLNDAYGKSSMVFVVVKITSQCRMRPIDSKSIYSEYNYFKLLEFGSKANLPEDKEEDVWFSDKGELNV